MADNKDKSHGDESHPKGSNPHTVPDAAPDQPEVIPDTRSNAHDARKNTGNASHGIGHSPVDPHGANTPLPKPRDNI